MNRLLVSAAHKSSGKTTVTLGLCAALSDQGQRVQPFKKGPDYIDPMWLAQASGRPCYNLDPYLMTAAQIRALFGQHAQHGRHQHRRRQQGPVRRPGAGRQQQQRRPGPSAGAAGAAGARCTRHDARHRAADPGLPGLRQAATHRRRDPEPPRWQPARGQAARRDRTLHRRARARRHRRRRAAGGGGTASGPHAQQRTRARRREQVQRIGARIAAQVDLAAVRTLAASAPRFQPEPAAAPMAAVPVSTARAHRPGARPGLRLLLPGRPAGAGSRRRRAAALRHPA